MTDYFQRQNRPCAVAPGIMHIHQDFLSWESKLSLARLLKEIESFTEHPGGPEKRKKVSAAWNNGKITPQVCFTGNIPAPTAGLRPHGCTSSAQGWRQTRLHPKSRCNCRHPGHSDLFASRCLFSVALASNFKLGEDTLCISTQATHLNPDYKGRWENDFFRFSTERQ